MGCQGGGGGGEEMEVVVPPRGEGDICSAISQEPALDSSSCSLELISGAIIKPCSSAKMNRQRL